LLELDLPDTSTFAHVSNLSVLNRALTIHRQPRPTSDIEMALVGSVSSIFTIELQTTRERASAS
ncbi:hypothetical protein SCB29_34325, partial [Paraburkholderia sp. SIMBA_055]